MKSILTLSIFALGAFATHAQSLSIGGRGGVSSMMHLDKNLHGEGKRVSCNKEVFVRYQTGSNWAFEVSAGHDSYNSEGNAMRGFGSCSQQNTPQSPERFTQSTTQVNFKAQYALSAASCGSHSCCPMMGRMKNYFGVVAGPTFTSTRSESDFNNSDGSTGTAKTRSNSTSLWAGLSNTLAIEVCPKMQVSGGFSWMVNTSGSAFGKSVPNQDYAYSQRPDSRFQWTLGLGYKL